MFSDLYVKVRKKNIKETLNSIILHYYTWQCYFLNVLKQVVNGNIRNFERTFPECFLLAPTVRQKDRNKGRFGLQSAETCLPQTLNPTLRHYVPIYSRVY